MIALLCASLLATAVTADLRTEMADIARSVDGRVGAAAMLAETGELVSVNGDKRFPMQSVYKAPIAMAALQRVDSGRLRLTQDVTIRASDMPAVHSPIRERDPGGATLTLRELLRAAVVESDGTASDALLKLLTPREVTQYVRLLGIPDMEIATTENQMSRDETAQYKSWSTPVGAVRWLAALHRGSDLSPESRRMLLGWMTETTIGPRRIKGLLPPGTPVAHKTGTDRTRNGLTRATNDIGLITLPDGRHLAVAVFVADSRATEADRERVIAWIARAAYDHWTARTASESR